MEFGHSSIAAAPTTRRRWQAANHNEEEIEIETATESDTEKGDNGK